MTTEPAGGTRNNRYVRKIAIEIWVFSAGEVYRGFAHRLETQRLSDVLNDVLSPSLKGPRTRFVPVTDVSIQALAGGEPSLVPFVALNKSHVQFVGEASPSRPMPGFEQVRESMRLVAVRIHLAGAIVLTGAILCPPGRRILDVSNDEREFVPVLGARARWPSGVAATFDFLAVAKAQIVRLEEIGGEPEGENAGA